MIVTIGTASPHSAPALRDEARRSPRRNGAGSILLVTLSLSVGFLALFLGPDLGASAVLRGLAPVSILLGLWAFVHHGGRRVTGAGIFCLTSGIMLGGGAWYWSTATPIGTTRDEILRTGIAVYLTSVAMYGVFWRGTAVETASPEPNELVRFPPYLTEYMTRCGILLFIAGITLKYGGYNFGALADAASYDGAILFSGAVIMHGHRDSKLRLRDSAAALGAFLYYALIFTGGGRLTLASLAFSCFLLAQYRMRVRLKTIIVALLIPAIAIFALIGVQRAASGTTQDSASGLGSLVNPLATFSRTVTSNLNTAHGSTFLAEFVILIPRRYWADKPVQYGRSVAVALDPKSGTYGQSDYTLSLGEWYYNFGWAGLLPGLVILGWLIRSLDRGLARRYAIHIETKVRLLGLVVFAILVGNVGDIAWGGTQPWTSRDFQRLLPIAVLGLIAASRLTEAPGSASNESGALRQVRTLRSRTHPTGVE